MFVTNKEHIFNSRDQLYYDGKPRSSAVFLLDTKIFINSVISDAHKGLRYGTVDIKYVYLKNLMDRFQYMKFTQKYFIDEIRSEYNIDKLVHNGRVFVENRKGMYGLKKPTSLLSIAWRRT